MERSAYREEVIVIKKRGVTMLELKGKYNTAKVFTDNIDAETISQVINLL